MSRRSLILCLVALAVLILGTGAAVAFLYSGTDGKKDRKEIRGDRDAGFALLSAVPSDAVMLACFSNAGAAPSGTYGDIVLPQSSAKSEAVVSMHYSGKLMPLYAFDAGKAADAPSEDASALIEAGHCKSHKFIFTKYWLKNM